MKTLSSLGTDFIDDSEGRRNVEYKDVAGYPTIGIGHKITHSELTSGKIVVGGRVIYYCKGLSERDIDELFAQDLAPVEECINKLVMVALTQYQFDALCSFIFNVGEGAFVHSTLLRLLNQGLHAEVPRQLRRWTKARVNGQVVDNKGLKLRRENEVLLWNNKWRLTY